MAKKRKVPKKIAGMKLPKPLRRGLRDLAASQNGRTVLLEALAAAGAVLAAVEAQPGSKARKLAAEKGPKLRGAAKSARGQAADVRAAATLALEEAARSFTEALRSRGPAETPAPPPSPPSAATH